MSKNGIAHFKKVLLIGKYKTSGFAEQVVFVAKLLKKMGLDVLIEKETATHSEITGYDLLESNVEMVDAGVDLVVVMGGDGTMLGVVRRLTQYNIPMVGINLGTLGFITSVAYDSVEKSLTEIIYGKYDSEHRILIETMVFRKKEVIFSTNALNDIVIRRGNMGSLLALQISVNEMLAFNQRSDGLIVATPTGSTAYALSAGGPIMHPEMKAFAIVPICPQTLSNRPLVLPSDVVLKVKVMKGEDISFHSDGQESVSLMEGDEIIIRSACYTAQFIHPVSYSYFDSLKEKLYWNFSG